MRERVNSMSESKVAVAGWRTWLFYALPTALYALWIIWLNAFPTQPSFMSASFMGRIAAILFLPLGGTWPTFHNFSASIELKLLFGPGFFAGLLVGYFRVRGLRRS